MYMGPLAHPSTLIHSHTHKRTRKSSWKDRGILKSITNRLHFHFSIFGKCSGPQVIFYYCFWNKQHEYMNELVGSELCTGHRSSTYMCIGICGRGSEKGDSLNEVTQWSSQLLNPNRMHIWEWATVNNSRNFPNRYGWYEEGCRRRRRIWRRYPFRCLIPVTCLHFLSILYLYFTQLLLKATCFFSRCCCFCCWQAVKKLQKKINKFQFLFSTVVKSTTLIITAMLGIQYLLLVCLLFARWSKITVSIFAFIHFSNINSHCCFRIIYTHFIFTSIRHIKKWLTNLVYCVGANCIKGKSNRSITQTSDVM